MSALETVARVAALRERAARSAFAAALAATRDGSTRLAEREHHLAAFTGDPVSGREITALRAAAVSDAAGLLEQDRSAQLRYQAAWQAAAQRRDSFADLAAAARAAQVERRLSAEQRESDDRAAARSRRGDAR